MIYLYKVGNKDSGNEVALIFKEIWKFRYCKINLQNIQEYIDSITIEYSQLAALNKRYTREGSSTKR
ncbi:hypothetical protein BDB01DRAFT_771255 [Pilobolus umbonatus]|nr:hypothetical protein BDB01DRAFT_771255 [Pilobolus umbonatus]